MPQLMEPQDCGAVLLGLFFFVLYYLGPLLGFLSYELAEVGRRAGHRRASQFGKPQLHLRIDKGRIDLQVEFVDDPSRCVLRNANATYCARLIAWYEIATSRDIRQRLRTRRGRHPQCRSEEH